MGAIIFVAFGLVFFFVLPRIGRLETDSPAVKAADLKVPQENAGYVIKGGADIELFLVKARILEINENEYGLPIAVCDAKLLSGGIFHRTETDCLIIANTAHTNDYFKYCLTIRVQGKSAFLSIRYYGESKLTGQMNKAEQRKESQSLSGSLANAMIGVDEAAYQDEYNYYEALNRLFESAFCSKSK